MHVLTNDSPEDSEIEVQNMRSGIGKLVPFESVWGHWAGGQYTRLEMSQFRFANSSNRTWTEY